MQILIVLFSTLLGLSGAHAQPLATVSDPSFPATIQLQDIDSIKSDLEADGLVRVIVEFQLPEGLAAIHSDQGLTAHKQAVKSTQERILGRIFGGTAHALQASGFERYLRQFAISPMFAITVDSQELKKLALDPEVKQIHPDRKDRLMLQDSVPLIGMQGVDGGYALGATGQGQAVAVLDTGVQTAHPFLTGKTIAQACFSNAYGAGVSLCPNGQNTQIGPGSAEATTGQCIHGSDNLCSHGTHVAGIAIGNNPNLGIPPNGVAKAARLIAIQAFTRFDVESSCGGLAAPCVWSFTADQIAALDWIYENLGKLGAGLKLAAVNMSMGGQYYATACDSDPRKPIIDRLRSAGVATVTTSGNDGFPAGVTEPGCISTAITVGATTLTDTVPYFSNESKSLVDLLAPGVGILSSVPINAYEPYSGTSMASPHVAGAFAAIKSRLPGASVEQIENALKFTGVPVPNRNTTYTTPRIAVKAALYELGIGARTLEVAKTGRGTVTSTPSGIDCGVQCVASFSDSVTLTAVSEAGYRFAGWGGACAGQATTCTLTIDADKNVTANFIQQYALTVAKTGNGRIVSNPAGIDCGAACSQAFDVNTSVTLTAKVEPGFRFDSWGGACTGSGACTVTMSGDQAVSAQFTELPKYLLRVTRPATGLVNSTPPGIACGGRQRACSGQFSAVTLTAVPNPGYAFKKWTGGCQSSTGATCNLTLDKPGMVRAIFAALPKYVLKVAKTPLGSITSTPPKLNCRVNAKSCGARFVSGTEVSLTAIPVPGRTFLGWTGACSGTQPVCTLIMDGKKGVAATFQ